MFAVAVHFESTPGQATAFLAAVKANAATSLEQEPGCQVFDVCTNPETPNLVFLYELYDDKAAFNAHLESAHFRAFDAVVAPMIAGKRVHTYSQVTR